MATPAPRSRARRDQFYFVGQGLFDGTTGKPSFITALDDQRRDYPCELEPNVWHTVAVVRKGNTIRTYLQGTELTTPEGPLGLPATAPSGKVVLGRSDIWQFFGLIDELVVFTRALDLPEIKTLMTFANQDLLAVWSFSVRPVHGGRAEVPQAHRARWRGRAVDTGGGSTADAKLLGPPSLQRPLTPFPTGEESIVGQGFDARQGLSHRGMAAFCLDWNRVDGKTVARGARGGGWYRREGAREFPRRDTWEKTSSADQISGANYIRVQHAAGEIGLYAHILQHSAVVGEGDVVSVGQKIASAGDTGASATAPVTTTCTSICPFCRVTCTVS